LILSDDIADTTEIRRFQLARKSEKTKHFRVSGGAKRTTVSSKLGGG